MQASNLARWLSNADPVKPCMAWCHTTNMWRLAKITREGKISPQHCEVFKEDLLYFFYGRPAYRKVSGESVNTTAKAPAVILFKPQAVQPVKRIYPFDSGAFPKLYSRWLAGGMHLDDFALGDDALMAQRHVRAFFGSNRNYLLCSAMSPTGVTGVEYEVETLVRMYQDTGAGGAGDDRRHAVELQIDHVVEFKSDTIFAVVLPEECMDRPELVALEAAGIELVGYQLVKQRPESEYQTELESLARAAQRKAGAL